MKRKTIIITAALLIALLTANICAAEPTDWFRAQSVTTELNINSEIDLVSTGSEAYVDEVKADIMFIPKNSETLAIRNFSSNPAAVMMGDRIRYLWQKPNSKKLAFEYNAIIETANSQPKVKSKIPFPTQPDPKLSKYTEPTRHIDSNDPAIIGQAYHLLQGEDDQFIAVSKIASWVKNNIEYNLSSLTADVSQNASWVLANRNGVCDEITTLFIAMLRAVKIPAKFVSGVAYTNSPQFSNGWGAHGWAEVYFPGTGWVPFDPTFGEYGWIDPGHIKLKESLDPREPTTLYEWRARETNVTVKDLKITARRTAETGKIAPELSISISPFRARVGFGSNNLIVAKVQNNQDHYVSTELILHQVKDMQIIGSDIQQVIVPPKGITTAFWSVKIKKDLDQKYQYELPIQVSTIRNDTYKSAFFAGKWDVTFSEADTISAIQKLTPEKMKFELACKLAEDKIWKSEARVDCILQNREDKAKTAMICHDNCLPITLLPTASVPVSFDIISQEPGMMTIRINATADQVTQYSTLVLTHADTPKVKITELILPKKVKYSEKFDVNFIIDKESISNPQNLTIKVTGTGVKTKVEIGELASEQQITLTLNSKDILSKNPTLIITASYADELGQNHEETIKGTTVITDIPLYKQILGFFTKYL